MPQFRKRPILVEAVQWFPGVDHPGVYHNALGEPYVITIHGQSTAIVAGDWILPEPDGEHHYPVKPDVFAATYEPVTAILAVDLSDSYLAEVTARVREATPGPWTWARTDSGDPYELDAPDGTPVLFPTTLRPLAISAANQRFLAESRMDVSNLLAEVRRRRELTR